MITCNRWVVPCISAYSLQLTAYGCTGQWADTWREMLTCDRLSRYRIETQPGIVNL
jgi:hypothetical protein